MRLRKIPQQTMVNYQPGYRHYNRILRFASDS